MPEVCPLLAGEVVNESDMLALAPYCARVCIPEAMLAHTPDVTIDSDCTHDMVHGDGFLQHLGGRQRHYTDQSVCLEGDDIVMVEEYSFKCLEN